MCHFYTMLVLQHTLHWRRASLMLLKVQKQLKYSCVPFQERPLPNSARPAISSISQNLFHESLVSLDLVMKLWWFLCNQLIWGGGADAVYKGLHLHRLCPLKQVAPEMGHGNSIISRVTKWQIVAVTVVGHRRLGAAKNHCTEDECVVAHLKKFQK